MTTHYQDGVSYILDSGLAVVHECLGQPIVLTIPPEINGHLVIGIDNGAFANNKSLNRIFLPDTIQEIGETAFLNCVNLIDVVFMVTQIPKHNKKIDLKIGDSAFFGCKNLRTFATQKRDLFLEADAFRTCEKLVAIGGRIKTVSGFCFYQCHSLQSLYFANGIQLDSVHIPWIFSLTELHFLKKATIDKDSLEYISRKNIKVYCNKTSPLVDLSYLGYNIQTI